MKKLVFSLIATVLFLNITTAQRGNDRTGFDGDNFSLEGALEVFRQSNSIRDFERKLNTRDSYVNNLDLNLDGRIDYVRVEHRRQGDYHAVIMQVPVNRRDVQDIAVIEVEKTGFRTAMLQIIGDEYIYGNQVYVEPIARGGDTYRNGAVNVFRWSAVRSILRANYNPWVSPYRYSYYPTWWSPWNPYAYSVFYPRTSFFRTRYHYVNNFRLWRVHNFYRPYRVYCNTFYTRSNRVHVINGTQRRPVNVGTRNIRRNAPANVARSRANTPARTNTRANTRNTTTRRANTTAPTRTAPTRSTASSRVTKRNNTAPTRATTSPTRTNRSRATTTTSRRNSSNVQRSPSSTRNSSTRRATTSRSSASRATSSRKSTRSTPTRARTKRN